MSSFIVKIAFLIPGTKFEVCVPETGFFHTWYLHVVWTPRELVLNIPEYCVRKGKGAPLLVYKFINNIRWFRWDFFEWNQWRNIGNPDLNVCK